ncbi:HEAT repeat domain-containing protein [Lederbergia graminis]|uniref:HEAT repeat domain-containing protein n=1 Tax=Lederbergia graminis TaxID=735518 RepID=A0ABW0LG68_9BACI
MTILTELSSQIGEKTEAGNRKVAHACIQNEELIEEIGEGLLSNDTALLGDCAEVCTMVAEQEPEKIVPYADRLMNLLDHKKTRVRWESMHAIALITTFIPEKITIIIPTLKEKIKSDKSTIVRDYAIETLCNYASVGPAEAKLTYPILKDTLYLWEGKHRARVLKGLLIVCQSTSEYTLEILGTAQEMVDNPKGVVKKAAKNLIKAIERGEVK